MTRRLLAYLVFAVLSVGALSHDLIAPNGLGVYAGKAKLFLEAGGVPEGFFTDARFASYQPSYPPGLTVLSLIVFAVQGHCGRGAVQLLVPLALAALTVLLTRRGAAFREGALAAALCASPLAMKMASGFYAEPFAALCLVAGARLVGCGRPRLGWSVVGSAALFRPEGLLLAGTMAIVSRMRCAGLALLPGLLWQGVVGWAGSGLSDYRFQDGPSPGHVVEAARVALAFAGPQLVETGGLAVALALGIRRGATVTFVLLATVAGVGLVACSVTPHFTWMVEGTLPRYLWTVGIAALGLEAALHAADGTEAVPPLRLLPLRLV